MSEDVHSWLEEAKAVIGDVEKCVEKIEIAEKIQVRGEMEKWNGEEKWRKEKLKGEMGRGEIKRRN